MDAERIPADLLPAAEPARRRPVPAWLAAAAALALVAGIAGWLVVRPWLGPALPLATPSPGQTPRPTASLAQTTPGPLAADGTRPLVGTTWIAQRVLGTTLAPGSGRGAPWVRFDADGRLIGHDGCNSFSGSYTLQGDALAVGPLSVGLMGCLGDLPGADITQAIGAAARVSLFASGLSLQESGGLEKLSFHVIVPSEEPVADAVSLRLTNNTGRAIEGVQVSAPDVTLRFGPLAAGASSEYQLPAGAVYRYAALEVRYADGTTQSLQPADYVGELPLSPGRYTYVLSTVQGPQTAGGSSLVLGFEESGRLAPRR